MMNFLQGKKTYIVGIVCIICGVLIKNVELIMLGLGLMGLRNAIK